MIKQKRNEMNHLILVIMSLIDKEKWIRIGWICCWMMSDIHHEKKMDDMMIRKIGI